MGSVETLFAQFSIESIILIILGLVVAFKFISELWDWTYARIKKHFNIQTEKQQQDEQDRADIKKLENDLSIFMDKMYEKHDTLGVTVNNLIEQQERTTERLQENTRSFIIDKHHYFCYQIKAIDDLNLQSLERRYMYYKADGGDSFIDQLMEEIRKLPRVNLQHRLEEIQRDGIM